MRRRLILSAALTTWVLLLTVFTAVVAGAADPVARGQLAKPQPQDTPPMPARIFWTPSVISVTQALASGESYTATASFSSTQNISNVTVTTHAPGPAADLTVSPTTFASVVAGQTYSVDIVITSRGGHSFAGTVALRNGATFLRDPLPVIWRPNTAPPARVTWTPHALNLTQALANGQSYTATATFSSTQNLNNVSVGVSQHGQGAQVTASPASFASIVAGQTYSVDVVVTSNGALHAQAAVALRQGSATLRDPMPVSWRMPPAPQVRIGWAPRAINVTEALSAGQSYTATAAFSSTADLNDVTVAVSQHGPGGEIKAVPAAFANIAAGQTYSVEVVITSNGGHSVGGTVSLRQGTRALRMPLSVTWRQPPAPAPHIFWTPSVISVTQPLGVGESYTVTATFTSSQTLANVTVQASHVGSGGAVTVLPSGFAQVVAGQNYSVDVVIRSNGGAGVTGTVALKQGNHYLRDPLRVIWRQSISKADPPPRARGL